MIIDCFTFFNELDLLESRLNYLYDKVDKFVLVEADITHSGKSKPFYFLENQNRYQKFIDKIISLQITIPLENLDWNHDISKGYNNASWQVENFQRNSIRKALEPFNDFDHVMISDLDEIPNKDSIDRAIRLLKYKPVVSFETQQFYYNLGQCLIEPWPATIITNLFYLKNTNPQILRMTRMNYPLVKNGGWHLTYFGSPEQIQNKIKNFAHQEFNNETFTDLNYISEKINNGQELYGRPFPIIKYTLDKFPQSFLDCFSRYKPKNQIEHYADSISGFFAQEDFEFYKKVVNNATDNCHFVEVGSYKGRSSAYMAVEIALSKKSIKFDCVDTWEGSEEHQLGQPFQDADVVNNRLYNVFLNNMSPVQGFFNPVKSTSIEASKMYQNNSLDFVFIDAAHDYDNVCADINAWAPKVKSGGIISGHDWHHLPIKKAVNDTLGEVNSFGNCWYTFIQ